MSHRDKNLFDRLDGPYWQLDQNSTRRKRKTRDIGNQEDVVEVSDEVSDVENNDIFDTDDISREEDVRNKLCISHLHS